MQKQVITLKSQRTKKSPCMFSSMFTSLPSADWSALSFVDYDFIDLQPALSPQNLFYPAGRWVKDCGSSVLLGQTLWSQHFPILLAWTCSHLQTCIQDRPGSTVSECVQEEENVDAVDLFKLRGAELAFGSLLSLVGEKWETKAVERPS